MSDLQDGGNTLASNPAYREAWTTATSGPTHEARQAAIQRMHDISAAPMPAPATPPDGAAAHRTAYDAIVKMSVGPARDAACLELATLSAGANVGYFRDRAVAAADPQQEALSRAADPDAPAPAHAAAGGLGNAEPAAPAIPAGYEPAGSIGEYRPPGLVPHDPDGMAKAMGAMFDAHIPAHLGKLALVEGVATVHYRISPAAYQQGLSDTLAKLTRAVGADEAASANRDARECIARMPANLREHATDLLVSPQCVIELARMRRLGAFPSGPA